MIIMRPAAWIVTGLLLAAVRTSRGADLFASFSMNGGPFGATSLARIPDDVLSGIAVLQLGSRGGAPTLMDEVMVFNRPLAVAEAKLIYDTVNAWVKKRDASPPRPVSGGDAKR